MKTKNQKIILTVGNRWVGFRVVRALILGHDKLGALRERNHIIRCLIRPEEDKKKLSVFNYKLLGIIEGDQQMFASLVNEDGNIINVGFFEELSPGVRLVGLNSKEVIFERDEGSLVVINFKNQIIERKN